MPGEPVQAEVCLLTRSPAAEHFIRTIALGPAEGLVTVLFRDPARHRPGQPAAPDLFDCLDLEAERREASLWFARDWRLTHRHAGLARSYDALQAAARLARIVAANPVAPAQAATVYRLLRRALAALAEGPRPEAAYLKALYLHARDEGLPVRADWAGRLAPADRAALEHVLARPLSAVDLPPAAAVHLARRLERWLAAEADFVIPPP